MDKYTKKSLWAFFNGVFFIVFMISCITYSIFLLTQAMYFRAIFMVVVGLVNLSTINIIMNCMKTYHNIEAIERRMKKSQIKWRHKI